MKKYETNEVIKTGIHYQKLLKIAGAGLCRVLWSVPVLLALTLTGHAQNAALTGYQTKADAVLQRRQLANLQQDFAELRELVQKLHFEIQDLKLENKSLKDQLAHVKRSQESTIVPAGIAPEDMDKVLSAMRAQIYKDLDKVRSDFYKSQDETLLKMNRALSDVATQTVTATPPRPPAASNATAGSTPAASPAAAASVDYEEYYEHKVAKNDTLYGIYRQYQQYKVYLDDIKVVNNITNPNKLKVGQVLILPVRK